MSDWMYKLPFVSHPSEKLVEGLDGILGDGDAIALLPYDDGTIYPKRAYFDKELVGGKGGYETDDGDKIIVDGEGTAVREFFGVPLLLAVDPTEHAGAVDLIKSLVAYKEDIGEWIRVDKKGNVVDAGEAVVPADPLADGSGVASESMVTDIAGTADPTDERYDAAMAQLAQQGDIHKIYDIAPPAEVVKNGNGELKVDQATHIAVDQSKAAELMPTTIDTTELNTALDKARMEEHEEGKLMKYFVYGMIITFIGETLLVGILLVMMNIL